MFLKKGTTVRGGRVFGYDNLEVLGPDGSRSHVERRVNEHEGPIVNPMFEMYVEGNGYTRIAKRLNDEGAPRREPNEGDPTGGRLHPCMKFCTVRSITARSSGTAPGSVTSGASTGNPPPRR